MGSFYLRWVHANTVLDVQPTMFQVSKFWLNLHNTHTREFKFFSAPTFRYETVDAVMEQFKNTTIAAAKPAAQPPNPKCKQGAKQMSIASFLR